MACMVGFHVVSEAQATEHFVQPKFMLAKFNLGPFLQSVFQLLFRADPAMSETVCTYYLLCYFEALSVAL